MESANNNSSPKPAAETPPEIITAIEQERQRIGRDLHDGAVQQIAFALYKLEFIQRLLEQQHFQAASQEVQKTTAILEESLQELYASINSLRPPQLEQHSLQAAIINLLSRYSSDNPGLTIHQQLPAIQRVPESLETPIFRLLQEALANIHQHAHASSIWIKIDIQGDQLVLSIKDNGNGFAIQTSNRSAASEDGPQAPASSHEHMGLRTMRERVQQTGGNWQLASQPGSGTTITASFPLSRPDTVA